MRRQIIGFSALLLVIAPLLLGMGGGGAPLSDTIPRPKENYAADLLDRQGLVTHLTLFSCNGKTFFPLERGEGMLMVPFAKVSRVKFGEDKGPEVEASIQIEGNKTLEGRLPRTLLCTGATEFGNYQVEARGLREIVLARP